MWGLFAITVLLVLWILSGSPWTTYSLWRDAMKYDTLFRQTAVEMLGGRSLQASDHEKALARLGYNGIEADNGVVFFYKYERFRGKGILGLAYAQGDLPSSVKEWAAFFSVPPHWFWLRMPNQLYIFAGR